MRYILDTCVLLWMLEGNKGKLREFTSIIEDVSNELVISVVSYWEITIKTALRKLEILCDWFDSIEETELIWLNLEPKHIHQLENLPLIHHDPFDRLLIAQSKAERMKLLTHNEKVRQYEII